MRITANKIDEWANTLDCRGKLPLLYLLTNFYNVLNQLSSTFVPKFFLYVFIVNSCKNSLDLI